MHTHQCRYCLNRFVCDEPTDECFRRYITCNECWFDHDLKHIALFAFLLIVAILATLCLFDEYVVHKEKPAFAAPVSVCPTNQKTTTGENYYNEA